jgi:excisionase family DNA binding protein
MDWMTTKEAAELWGVKVRQVQTLCERGLVMGATKMSEVWLLPKSAVKPQDGRTKAAKLSKGKKRS